MFSLEGQKAVITGATGGIGQAIAHALSAQGAEVVLCGTRQQVLEDLCDKIPNAKPLVCSLSDETAVSQLIFQAEELLGGLDILVNNAGITKDNISLRMSDEEWMDVIQINLTSTFKLCRAAVKSMMKRRYGRIINMASIVGVMGNAGQANYCASKAGMIGMSKALAREVASRNITINCIAPGFILTPMTEALSEDQQKKLAEQIPQGRMGTGNDIAAGVCYLASKEASYITGQTLHINGGMLMI